MRTTFNTSGSGGWPEPAAQPRSPRLTRIALIVALLIAALGWGTLVAAAYDALTDLDAHGEMDPSW